MSLVEQAQEKIRVQTRGAWRDALSTEAGRLMVWSILEECGVFQTSFNPDAGLTAFAEGKRAVGLSILNNRVLSEDAHLFAKMMNESAARHDEVERAIQKENEE